MTISKAITQEIMRSIIFYDGAMAGPPTNVTILELSTVNDANTYADIHFRAYHGKSISTSQTLTVHIQSKDPDNDSFDGTTFRTSIFTKTETGGGETREQYMFEAANPATTVAANAAPVYRMFPGDKLTYTMTDSSGGMGAGEFFAVELIIIKYRPGP